MFWGELIGDVTVAIGDDDGDNGLENFLFGESDLDLRLLVGLTKFEITNLLALVGVAVSYGGDGGAVLALLVLIFKSSLYDLLQAATLKVLASWNNSKLRDLVCEGPI